MAWTAPRTWATGELVTATMLNTHVRDELSLLYPLASAKGVAVGRDGTATVSGADIVPAERAWGSVDWDLLTAQGTAQIRYLFGFNITVLNGCTALTATAKLYREFAKNAQGGTHANAYARATPGDFALSTGWKVFDSGWGAVAGPTGDGYGIYLPSYRFDFTTAAPTILTFQSALQVRIA